MFFNKEKKEENKELLKNFIANSNYKIGDMYFDDKNKKLLIKKSVLYNRKQLVIDYNEILSYTPIFQGGHKKKHHGITRAVVGSVLAGPVGALIGAGTGGSEFDTIHQLGVALHLTEDRSYQYMLIKAEQDIELAKSHLEKYNNIIAKLEQIKKTSDNSGVINPSDDIRKYKALLDDNIITEQEFEQKKKELLGL